MKPFFRDYLRPTTPGPFRVGDRVRLLWGVTPVEATVVEDRGNLGVGGRRVYRIRVHLEDGVTDDEAEPIETERPVDDLTLVARAPARSRNGRRGNRAGKQPDNGPARTEPKPE